MMVVLKFKTVEQMNHHDWVLPKDAELGRYISEVWAFAAKLAPQKPRRGVTKYRSLKDLNRYNSQWKDAKLNRP